MKLAKLNGKPEIFYSIQGEGKSMGKPSIFVRTSQCNLHCVWCDTDYTWNWKGTKFAHLNDSDPQYSKYDRKEWIEEIDIPEIIALIRQYDCKNIILTGGEPLLQQKELVELIRLMRDEDEQYQFELETNGTLVPSTLLDLLVNQYNVSPKLENSANSVKLREKPEAYSFFAANPKSVFKYVIDEKQDLDEVLELISAYNIPKEKVYLMPQSNSMQELAKKRQLLVEICKDYGFNYSDRLHVQIWGGKKGV